MKTKILNRKILTFNVSKDQNCLSHKWFGGYHIILRGDLSDGGKYIFGWHGNKNTTAMEIYPWFKVFMKKNNIEY